MSDTPLASSRPDVPDEAVEAALRVIEDCPIPPGRVIDRTRGATAARRPIIRAALAAARPFLAGGDETLPCEVIVAPCTRFGRGVALSTVLDAIRRRDGRPDDETTIASAPKPPALAQPQSAGALARDSTAATLAANERYPNYHEHDLRDAFVDGWDEAEAALASATSGRGWEPKIGEKVRVVGQFEADWRGIDLWVAGLQAEPFHEGLNVTVSEAWPLSASRAGLTDGFYVYGPDASNKNDLAPPSSPAPAPGEQGGES